MEENGLTLLKQEMQNEEIHIKVNAIHRLKTVILSIGEQETCSQLIEYLDGKFSFLKNHLSRFPVLNMDDLIFKFDFRVDQE
jgi:hypothetical protein